MGVESSIHALRTRLTKFVLRFAVVSASMVAAVSFLGQSDIPEKFTSPDGKYLVQMVQKAMPGSDSLDDFTLVVALKGKIVIKVPTYGYLIAAHWSPDGKYVAVNNRRGNSGDYLWVFDLRSGKAVKQPDDKNGESWEKAAAAAVHKEWASADEDTLVRDWVTAQGWEGDQLKVVIRSVYRGSESAWDLETVVDPVTWQIQSSKLVKTTEDADE